MSRRRLVILALVIAAVGVLIRLPFLVRGEWFFDSDEAVDALMARHILHGELPILYWGQGYKGVPHDYLAAAVFALFGSSVVAAKAVTLALYALYLAVQFVVLARMFSPRVSLLASVLSITGPPALVHWSLSVNAEFVLLMLVGTVLLFVLYLAQQSGALRYWVAGAFLAGVSLWLHPLSIYYLAAAGVVLALDSSWWRTRPAPAWWSVALARPVTGWRRPVAVALNVVGVVYLLLAIHAFAFGGLAPTLLGLTVSARHPQKLLRLAVAAWGASILLQALSVRETRRWDRYGACAVAFLAGLAPSLLYWAFVARTAMPMRSMDAVSMGQALPSIAGEILPIVAGFRMPTGRLAVPAVLALVPIAGLLAFAWFFRAAFGSLARLRPWPGGLAGRFFPALLVVAPAVFLFSGAYIDVQSYRYLVPLFAGLFTALALGLDALGRRSRPLAAALVCALVATFAWQQVAFYRTLQPDDCSRALIENAIRQDVKGGYADYWTAYKITFLSGERLVVAPLQGDRYPAFARYVEGLDRIALIGPAADPKLRGFSVESTYPCGAIQSTVMRRDKPTPSQ